MGSHNSRFKALGSCVCVDVPSSATYLNWSLIFEWYMNKYGSKNI